MQAQFYSSSLHGNVDASFMSSVFIGATIANGYQPGFSMSCKVSTANLPTGCNIAEYNNGGCNGGQVSSPSWPLTL